MKKTVICIVSTAAAFVLATALNIQNMIWGDTPSVLGFVFSLVFCACLFVLPAVAKNRAFAVVSACYAAFSAIASTVGLLAVKGIISGAGGVGCRFAAYRVLWAEIYHERLQRFLFRAHRFHAHSRTESYFDREKVCGGKSIKQQISIHGADRSAGLLFLCPAPKSRTFCRNS